MDKQQIIDYVMETPENINPVILGQFLDELGGGGGGATDFKIFIVNETRVYNGRDYTATLDKTWKEIYDATEEGYDIMLVKEDAGYHDEWKDYVTLERALNIEDSSYEIETRGPVYFASRRDGYPNYIYEDK